MKGARFQLLVLIEHWRFSGVYQHSQSGRSRFVCIKSVAKVFIYCIFLFNELHMCLIQKTVQAELWTEIILVKIHFIQRSGIYVYDSHGTFEMGCFCSFVSIYTLYGLY